VIRHVHVIGHDLQVPGRARPTAIDRARCQLRKDAVLGQFSELTEVLGSIRVPLSPPSDNGAWS
jgi:hypothetical protein